VARELLPKLLLQKEQGKERTEAKLPNILDPLTKALPATAGRAFVLALFSIL
jgi:hypothetical protein